jgi:predicted transcriptional regulator
MKQYPIIDAHEKLKTAIDLLLDSQNKNFLVTDNAVPVGTLNRDQIILALGKRGENEIIANIMDPNLIFLEADSLIENVYEDMYKNKSTLMLIRENNKVIGALDTENLLEFILIEEVKLKKDHAA